MIDTYPIAMNVLRTLFERMLESFPEDAPTPIGVSFMAASPAYETPYVRVWSLEFEPGTSIVHHEGVIQNAVQELEDAMGFFALCLSGIGVTKYRHDEMPNPFTDQRGTRTFETELHEIALESGFESLYDQVKSGTWTHARLEAREDATNRFLTVILQGTMLTRQAAVDEVADMISHGRSVEEIANWARQHKYAGLSDIKTILRWASRLPES